jgi:hypothetical protein
MYAAEIGSLEAMTALIEHGADVKWTRGRLLLSMPRPSETILKSVRLLLNAGADINTPDTFIGLT